jgi:hypothetical protein
MPPDEVNRQFAQLSETQIAEIAPKIVDDYYDRQLCHDLGIEYGNIRLIDSMKLYLHRAYMQGFLREG